MVPPGGEVIFILEGGDLVEKFAGTRKAEAVERVKCKILEITRINYVEKFLFLPAEELLPDQKVASQKTGLNRENILKIAKRFTTKREKCMR
jgi:hypothetical protein